MLYNTHPCQKSDSKLSKLTGIFVDSVSAKCFHMWMVRVEFSYGWCCLSGRKALSLPSCLGDSQVPWDLSYPEVIPILGLSKNTHAFKVPNWLQGDEHGHCVIGQANRVIGHLSSVVSLLFLGCHTFNLWEQHLHWKINLVSKLCIAKYTNKYNLINFTKWTTHLTGPQNKKQNISS